MQPSEAPPPYKEAVSGTSSTLQVPGRTRSGIPPQLRRSMEDENRPIPEGWVRQFDHRENHQFFVDTRTNPPRSIWHHPYDDEQYMLSLTPEERSRIQDLGRIPTNADIEAESSYDESAEPSLPSAAAPGTGTTGQPVGAKKLGRRMKDALTNTTHEQREARRRQRDEEERRAYEVHQRFRTAMTKAAQTGEPQLLGRDSEDREVYIEPPYGPGNGFAGDRMYGGRAYGYNPFAQGLYGYPDARFLRPTQPYSRPLGYGYGGGYGGGLGMPLMGLGGGFMLGSMLF